MITSWRLGLSRIFVSFFIVGFLFLFSTAGNVFARCQSPAGGYYDPACDSDYECSRNTDCPLGVVCNTNKPNGGKLGTCESPLGDSRIVNNTIAGGYSVTGAGLGSLINNIVLAVGAVSGLIFFAMLVLGGINYMSSQGDEKQVMHAKNQITAGLVGLLIVFMSWWGVKVIGFVFGIELLVPKFTGP
jgi:hypothetical protein